MITEHEQPQTASIPSMESLSKRYNNLSEKQRVLLEALLKKKQKKTQSSRKSSTSEQQNSPLLKMRPTGSRTPFFCVHALLGSAYHFYHLANLLDKEQPFYALQAPGLDGVEKPLDKIEDFATLYLKSVREVQPKGPYRLGGYSFGGWIAFEMAQQLLAEGEETEMLVFLGSGIPLSVSHPSHFTMVDFLGQYMKDFNRIMIQPFFSPEQRMAMDSSGMGKLSAPLMRVFSAHIQAVLFYEPHPYSGKVIIFETMEQEYFAPLDPKRGWGRLSLQEVETHRISGNHLSMLDEPHIHEVAKYLNEILHQLDGLD